MKFNKLAVVMNPPYQKADGGFGRSAGPLYHEFITKVIDDLQPNYLISINPSRWMTGGKGLDNFRARMIQDKRVKKIVHFAGERDIFPQVSIPGGVNYFLWDKNYNGKCEFVMGNQADKGTHRFLNENGPDDIVLQDNNASTILDKVKRVTTKWISQKCSSLKPFDLRTFYKDWTPTGTKCYAIGKGKIPYETHYVDPNCFTDKNNILGKWKVLTGEANGAAQKENAQGAKRVLTNVFIIEPEAICTETFIVVNAFNTRKEAENFVAYTHTKFFRYMLGLRVTKHITKERFSWVPDLDLPITDEQIYKIFDLTETEQAIIENKIITWTENKK